jgi:hypothetical protein
VLGHHTNPCGSSARKYSSAIHINTASIDVTIIRGLAEPGIAFCSASESPGGPGGGSNLGVAAEVGLSVAAAIGGGHGAVGTKLADGGGGGAAGGGGLGVPGGGRGLGVAGGRLGLA